MLTHRRPRERRHLMAVLGGALVLGIGLESPAIQVSTADAGVALRPAVSEPGTWTSAGVMTTARIGPSATLLNDGDVLVAGGYTTRKPSATAPSPDVPAYLLSSAELYDPSDGTWTPTGSMTTARVDATATLLTNGKVLVSGDAFNLQSPVTADLYDPAAGTWTQTGSLTTINESVLTATRLDNGEVLATGDTQAGDVANRAELYNPATGAWTPTADLTQHRLHYTATLLGDGKVLVTGGMRANPRRSLASAELYDPANGTWTLTGYLARRRYNQTATLLDNGKVLVSGGERGVKGVDHFVASAELYDPTMGTWAPTGSMEQARSQGTATLLADGRVLVTSGHNGNHSLLARAELYDPATGTWAAAGAMAHARLDDAATLLTSGKVLVTGGQTAHDNAQGAGSDSAELYTPGS